MHTDSEFMKTFMGTIRKHFPVVRYAFGVYTPVYIGGQCGFLLASKNKVLHYTDCYISNQVIMLYLG